MKRESIFAAWALFIVIFLMSLAVRRPFLFNVALPTTAFVAIGVTGYHLWKSSKEN